MPRPPSVAISTAFTIPSGDIRHWISSAPPLTRGRPPDLKQLSTFPKQVQPDLKQLSTFPKQVQGLVDPPRQTHRRTEPSPPLLELGHVTLHPAHDGRVSQRK